MYFVYIYFSFLGKRSGRRRPPAERSALFDIRIPICTMGHRWQCVCCIRNRGRLDLSYDARASCGRREAGRDVCCSYDVVWGVEGGGGLSVRWHSYGKHRVERWRASDWLRNDKKQLKVTQKGQTRVCTWALSGQKKGTMRLGPMAGLVGCVFDLILACTCFRPQTDQVYLF